MSKSFIGKNRSSHQTNWFYLLLKCARAGSPSGNWIRSFVLMVLHCFKCVCNEMPCETVTRCIDAIALDCLIFCCIDEGTFFDCVRSLYDLCKTWIHFCRCIIFKSIYLVAMFGIQWMGRTTKGLHKIFWTFALSLPNDTHDVICQYQSEWVFRCCWVCILFNFRYANEMCMQNIHLLCV